MALNIKNKEAEALVDALHRLTGESKTQAVIQALSERLERERQRRNQANLATELLAIGRRCATAGRGDTTPHGDLLYDKRGLPR